MVGPRPQHAVSKLPCLVLSSARSCRSGICPGRLTAAWLVSLSHLFLSYGLQVVTHEVHRSSLRRLLICTWDNTTVSRKRTRIKRYNEESWQAGRHTPNTGISSKAPLRQVYNSYRCAASYDIMVQRHGHLRPHRPKWKEVCSTSHTKIERPTSESGRGQKS